MIRKNPTQHIFTLFGGFFFLFFFLVVSGYSSASIPEQKDTAYDEYVEFFEEVYQSMNANYYSDIHREDFDRFIKEFDQKIYANLKNEGKSNAFIRWRSSAYLVDFLKDKEDVFSAFFPPEPAKEYEETALGKKIDLGVEGNAVALGYNVSFVEPRSDAYEKGLRQGDIIVAINQENLADKNLDVIRELLVPEADSITRLDYLSRANGQKKTMEVISREYFRQTVFPIPIPVDGIYGLEIRKFNRKTSDDLFRYLTIFRQLGDIKGLVLDLRNNPGGPPLAAREISSFFLPPKDDFAVFKKRGNPIAKLDVPQIPSQYHYDGPMVIMVNEESGSASELFSGILQKRGRAVLVGEKSAGQVMLKSMYHFDDDSMLLLVTARGHHPNGDVFSFKGLVPDRFVDQSEPFDSVKQAVAYLNYVQQ